MFQSTLPRRERRSRSVFPRTCFTFQSTLPRRERRQINMDGSAQWSFNPRSRAGSDPTYRPIRIRNLVSIHAPAQGATNYGLVESRNHLGFNPRSRAGSDMMSCPDLPKSCVFQSTLPRRERRLTHNLLNINNFFAILCVSIIFHLKKSSVVKGHFANIAI